MKKSILIVVLVIIVGILLHKNMENSVLETTGTVAVQKQEDLNLYARSAVLLDADSGRILYGKNEDVPMAMASTTKIMTLIVALEQESKDEIVSVSAYAAAQPKVHLGMRKGEQYYLEDLYYSLMLESHNDTAVCIAEHLGNRLLGKEWEDAGKEESKKAVQAFLDKMNEKAKELGLHNTCFLTPNGLDGQITSEDGQEMNHQTTAEELALILRYCILKSPKREEFLEITRTISRSFCNIDGTRRFTCTNHNLFLQMMDGALTGKTGFTSKAGYCYVGALKRDDRTFIVALLACGWPNNKGYKWVDTRTLMTYGLEKYSYKDVYKKDIVFEPIEVIDGIPENENWSDKAYTTVALKVSEEAQTLKVLLGMGETVDVVYKGKERLQAPVYENDVVGTVRYLLKGDLIAEYPVYAQKTVEKQSYFHALWVTASKYIPGFP